MRYRQMKSDITDLTIKPGGYYESLREDMLKYIPGGTRTSLEFGCGFGGFSAQLKRERGIETWGVEISAAAAAKAAGVLDKVIVADAFEAINKLPDNYFDCIVFLDVLEHLVNPYAVLLAIKSKMTPKGVIIASIPNIRYYRKFVDFVIHGNWDYEEAGIMDKTHLRFFTFKSIIKTFDQTGFEIIILEGMHPTHSRTYRIINILLCGLLADLRYQQFAVVARPKRREKLS